MKEKCELVKELRMMDLSSDRWATALGAHFSVCDELLYRGADIPAAWGFRPGACHVPARDLDEPWTEVLMERSDQELVVFGNILHRYTHLLERHGHSY